MPRKQQPAPVAATPVVLDEHDRLMAVLPKLPNDGGFRRGLYMLLLALGLLTAYSMTLLQQSRDDIVAARKDRTEAEQKADQRQADLDEVLANQTRLAERNEELQRLVITIIARSEDPALREAFREIAEERGIDPDALEAGEAPSEARTGPDGGGPGPSPSPRPSRPSEGSEEPQEEPQEPAPSPSPSPEPEPTPLVPLPGGSACVIVLGTKVCTPEQVTAQGEQDDRQPVPVPDPHPDPVPVWRPAHELRCAAR